MSKLSAAVRKVTKAASANSNHSSSEPPRKDFVAIAIAYAETAIEDHEHYGVWIRLAAKRFLKDLTRVQSDPGCPFTFDARHANRPCRFIELLPHVEGTWDSDTIILHPSHVFFVVNLFGFRNRVGGFRRFTAALFCVARKNAKSTLAGAIMLYCACFENEMGAQLISAATTGSQARIVFNIAKRMAEMLPDLMEEFDLECFASSIVRHETGAVFKPINSKASTQDGLNPSHASLDEIHAHKNHDLVNVIRSAAGARRCPLWLYTTTEGFESPGPWAEERAFAESILEEAVEADHYLAVIYALDDEREAEDGTKIPADDDFDEDKWQKANPLIDVNPLLMTENRKLAIEARSKPGALAEFRIKRLNRRAASAQAWVNLTKWRRCGGTFLREHMKGADCFAAFDLSATTDMAAWRILWILNGHAYTWGRYWVPEDAVAQRTERKSVNYAGWIETGLVTLCDGATNDFNQIEADIKADIDEFQPQIIAYDPWNATQFVNNLIASGVDLATPEDPRGLMQFIQGPKSYTPAMGACQTAYLNEKLSHGGDPVLTWHMANVVPTYDANMNVRPNKLKSRDKIDGAVALFMCFGASVLSQADDGAFSSPAVIA